MQLIQQPLASCESPLKSTVYLISSRSQLQKRIWRGVAEDGKVFGFDLEEPLRHNQTFYQSKESIYIIQQEAEAVYRVDLKTPKQAAETAWMIGNLHFSASFSEKSLIVPIDPALQNLFTEHSIAYCKETMVFQPPKGRIAHQH